MRSVLLPSTEKDLVGTKSALGSTIARMNTALVRERHAKKVLRGILLETLAVLNMALIQMTGTLATEVIRGVEAACGSVRGDWSVIIGHDDAATSITITWKESDTEESKLGDNS